MVIRVAGWVFLGSSNQHWILSTSWRRKKLFLASILLWKTRAKTCSKCSSLPQFHVNWILSQFHFPRVEHSHKLIMVIYRLNTMSQNCIVIAKESTCWKQKHSFPLDPFHRTVVIVYCHLWDNRHQFYHRYTTLTVIIPYCSASWYLFCSEL